MAWSGSVPTRSGRIMISMGRRISSWAATVCNERWSNARSVQDGLLSKSLERGSRIFADKRIRGCRISQRDWNKAFDWTRSQKDSMLTAHGPLLAKVSLKGYVKYMKKAPLRRSAAYSRSCCRCQLQSNVRDVISEAKIFHREDKRTFLVREEENGGAGKVRSTMSMFEKGVCENTGEIKSSELRVVSEEQSDKNLSWD